ncbi:uncharacterized protein LOC127604961 [Hippocampus zosterae]|uniref:uncharacterized protein LOC127604961 n=1 Tax=Hippocampus zosterae TaxID=109293 RepID=UPI00223E5A4D|nr:uncharacterized protein LOC127604961 [Hippocampus zosterae]
MDELLLLTKTNKTFARSAALCFTETWLSDRHPDPALHLPGFRLLRADRDTELSGKSNGGGICFYINEEWCTDVTKLDAHCSPDLESLSLNCKPFYSPHEFTSFLLVGVYIAPQANANTAIQTLAEQVNKLELKYPESPLIILGDFNRAHLNRELPRYKQHIDCFTREGNILDHCYTTIKNAYRSVARAALGLSDHNLIHLIPTYRQKLKCVKPVVKTVKKWTDEAKLALQECLDCTDWGVFETSTGTLDEYTDTVTSYISFCEDMCVPTKSFCSFNNNKPWFTPKLRQLRKEKEAAFRSGDRALYKHARNQLTKEINIAKRSYAERLKNQFSANDSASVWNGLKAITNYRMPSPQTVNNKGLANELNMFFCRFEKDTPISHTHPPLPETTLPSPPPSFSPLQIHEQDVRRLFKQQKIKKAPGPDKVSPSCLKVCADQLAPVFTQIFNRSLELCEVPSCFKQSTIIPVPKKSATSELNDYRPVALTSVVMKSFERLVLNHLKNVTGPLLDPLQFAYRANSSAFNTIIPELLTPKLLHLGVSPTTCQWILSFLTGRTQQVRLGSTTSSIRTTSTGAPQGWPS